MKFSCANWYARQFSRSFFHFLIVDQWEKPKTRDEGTNLFPVWCNDTDISELEGELVA